MDQRCSLCQPEQLPVLWSDALCRVVWVTDPDYPGYVRVIWHEHVVEMTDLSWLEAQHLWRILWGVEQAMRVVARPDKVNWASFGNQVPHLHWHAIPRYRDDPHFPEPYWGRKQRHGASPRAVATIAAMQSALIAELGGSHATALA